jgi:hypothetical protein
LLEGQTFAPTGYPTSRPTELGFVCNNQCRYKFDVECDDGGLGSSYAVCDRGTDCSDCGPRRIKTRSPTEPPTYSPTASTSGMRLSFSLSL